MNTNDLPPAAKLACLIETGAAANPDLTQGIASLLEGKKACAIGFAALAAGASRKDLLSQRSAAVAKVFDVPYVDVLAPLGNQGTIYQRVIFLNDKGASLNDICRSLREGELAKVPAYA